MVQQVSQAGIQAATIGQGVSAVTQLGMMLAYAPPSTRMIDVTQLGIQAATVGQGIPAVTQAGMLIAYRVNATENLTMRSWGFTLDGHDFYCVTLGEQGTWVYDVSTGQWAQWQTAGYTQWNMQNGTTWRGMVLAADSEEPIIWKLNPGSFIDNDFKAQTRTVTGGLSTRNRTFVANYAFRLTASLGMPDVPTTTIPETTPTVQLLYSDDQGNTFVDAGTVTVETGVYVQDLQWLSLGIIQPPLRVFKVTDTGAVARIDGADAEIEEPG